jgi:hypothetical protein
MTEQKTKLAYCKICHENRSFVKTDTGDYCCGVCRFIVNKLEKEK